MATLSLAASTDKSTESRSASPAAVSIPQDLASIQQRYLQFKQTPMPKENRSAYFQEGASLQKEWRGRIAAYEAANQGDAETIRNLIETFQAITKQPYTSAVAFPTAPAAPARNVEELLEAEFDAEMAAVEREMQAHQAQQQAKQDLSDLSIAAMPLSQDAGDDLSDKPLLTARSDGQDDDLDANEVDDVPAAQESVSKIPGPPVPPRHSVAESVAVAVQANPVAAKPADSVIEIVEPKRWFSGFQFKIPTLSLRRKQKDANAPANQAPVSKQAAAAALQPKTKAPATLVLDEAAPVASKKEAAKPKREAKPKVAAAPHRVEPPKAAVKPVRLSPAPEEAPVVERLDLSSEIARLQKEYVQFKETFKQNPPVGREAVSRTLQQARSLLESWRTHLIAFKEIGDTDAFQAAERAFQEITGKDLNPAPAPVEKPTSVDETPVELQMTEAAVAAVAAAEAEEDTPAPVTVVAQAAPAMPMQVQTAPVDAFIAPVAAPSESFSEPVEKLAPSPWSNLHISAPVQSAYPSFDAPVEPIANAPIDQNGVVTLVPSAPDYAPALPETFDGIEPEKALGLLIKSIVNGEAPPVSNPISYVVAATLAGKERLPIHDRITLAEQIMGLLKKAKLPKENRRAQSLPQDLAAAFYREIVDQEIGHCSWAFYNSGQPLDYMRYLHSCEQRLLDFIRPDATQEIAASPVREILVLSLCQGGAVVPYTPYTTQMCSGFELTPAISHFRDQYLQLRQTVKKGLPDAEMQQAVAQEKTLRALWEAYIQAYRIIGIPEAYQTMAGEFSNIIQNKPTWKPGPPVPEVRINIDELMASRTVVLPAATLEATRAAAAADGRLAVQSKATAARSRLSEERRPAIKHVSYIETMLGEPTSAQAGAKLSKEQEAEWFTQLPTGVQYRLYNNLCAERIGVHESRLSKLHDAMPGFLYRAMFHERGLVRGPIDTAPFTPQFMRNKLQTVLVQKRLEKGSKEMAPIMKSIQSLTNRYLALRNYSAPVASFVKIDAATMKFLAENTEFLGYVLQQAASTGKLTAGSDISWAKEHFLDDASIFIEALTHWHDTQPIKR